MAILRISLKHYPLTWNRTGPLSHPATHGIVRLGWPGGEAGWFRMIG